MNAIIIIVFIAALFYYLGKPGKEKVKYTPVYFSRVAGLPDNEALLYSFVVSLLDEDVYSFTPHDIGVIGFNTSNTY